MLNRASRVGESQVGAVCGGAAIADIRDKHGGKVSALGNTRSQLGFGSSLSFGAGDGDRSTKRQVSKRTFRRRNRLTNQFMYISRFPILLNQVQARVYSPGAMPLGTEN